MPLFSDPWAPAKAALLHLMSSGSLPTGGGPSAVEAGFSGAPSTNAPAWLKQLSGQGQSPMVFDPGSVTGSGSPSFVPGSVTGGAGGPAFNPGSVTGAAGGGDPGVWGNPATQDSVDAWFADAVVKAIGDPARLNHLLASVQGSGGPQGSLLPHYLNMIKGVIAGDPGWISEARHYASGYVKGGPNTPLV